MKVSVFLNVYKALLCMWDVMRLFSILFFCFLRTLHPWITPFILNIYVFFLIYYIYMWYSQSEVFPSFLVVGLVENVIWARNSQVQKKKSERIENIMQYAQFKIYMYMYNFDLMSTYPPTIFRLHFSVYMWCANIHM